MIVGGLSEWFKELVLKTCEGSSPSVGSNPTPSFVEKTKWENGKHCVTLEELLEEIKKVYKEFFIQVLDMCVMKCILCK